MTTPNRELADSTATSLASGERRALNGPPIVGTSSRQTGLAAAVPPGVGVALALEVSAPGVDARRLSVPAPNNVTIATIVSVTAATASGPRFIPFSLRRVSPSA